MTRTTKRAFNRIPTQLASPVPASNVLLTLAAAKRHTDASRWYPMPIRAGHCSECNVRIPSGQLQRALSGKTIQCEHCHRVLYVGRARAISRGQSMLLRSIIEHENGGGAASFVLGDGPDQLYIF